MANQDIIVSSDVFPQLERFEIRCINGNLICAVEVYLHQPCRAIKQHVSNFLSMCKCKFRLVAGEHVLRDDLDVQRIMTYMQHTQENIINFIAQPIELTTVADLYDRGVCFKCMREVGGDTCW